MLKILVILTYFSQISIAQVVDTTGEKQCYYCGLVDNCEMPYNVKNENVKKISCEKSCLKFDGNAKDGKRVVLRFPNLNEILCQIPKFSPLNHQIFHQN